MDNKNRIKEHHVLEIGQQEEVTFYWNKLPLKARKGEVIASALIANGIKIFGYHPLDHTPQGMFCANGQCAKCGVIANGIPVKSCMVKVKENMIVESMDGLPELPLEEEPIKISEIKEYKTDILIIGGGPAGLSAAIELANYGYQIILIDDKNQLGGKLVLQTHKFFGSVEDSYAGTRGIDIGKMLANKIEEYPNCSVWLNSTALFVFKDKKVGILKDDSYKIVEPRIILNTAGAREKFLRFPGNTLPGIYGAGAFQTLANRDLVRPSERLFIVGGGNVGLIAGYHAIQAGITVVGLVEAMPTCGGYKVHSDKLKRLGVPIYTSHTVLSAQGKDGVESVTIVEIDKDFQPIRGTEKTFLCDTILIAVGLEPLNEFTEEAEKAGIKVFAAGDSDEIAEASSAMFNGKIIGLKLAKYLGAEIDDIPAEWYDKAEVLKRHPGKTYPQIFPDREEGVFPVIHCLQEIPCNPCTTVCPLDSIELLDDPIMGLPIFKNDCTGCHQCLTICPGLAITLVDFRQDRENPIVTVPYEVSNYPVNKGDTVIAVDIDGNSLAELPVVNVITHKNSKTNLVKIKAPRSIAKRIVAFRIQNEELTKPLDEPVITTKTNDDAMVCLCERVKVGEVRELIRKGVTDINQIKALTRLGMGPCGSKTCDTLIRQIFREEGVPETEIVSNTKRPVFIEVPLKYFVDAEKEKSDDE
ncbi:MAG: FAD-dependent oxidoreductase [Candidatus Cloacimonetes bacterium]|nr:FAD-dependent oxidoreductase [Candidatus Cloacimonadota bacterium]